MVSTSDSAVTKERFGSGPDYDDYLNSLEKGKARYDENFEGFELAAEDAQFFKDLVARPDGPKKVLVITEWWCPDCWREVPVMEKIALASGMELRILARDENLDVMNEFLRDGEFQSIPVFVFYTDDMKYIYHFIERSEVANAETVKMREEMDKHETQEERRAAYIEFQHGPDWARWRQETVKELRDKLSAALGA
jgi:Thioredoxin